MTTELEIGLYIFMLAGFLGYHIITRVPPLLHTPLMSATNAIAAISLVGSLVVAGSDYSNVPHGWVCTLLGLIAVTCSATNAVGGVLSGIHATGQRPGHRECRARAGYAAPFLTKWSWIASVSSVFSTTSLWVVTPSWCRCSTCLSWTLP